MALVFVRIIDDPFQQRTGGAIAVWRRCSVEYLLALKLEASLAAPKQKENLQHRQYHGSGKTLGFERRYEEGGDAERGRHGLHQHRRLADQIAQAPPIIGHWVESARVLGIGRRDADFGEHLEGRHSCVVRGDAEVEPRERRCHRTSVRCACE